MLSKSQARTFFLGGTTVFSLIFIALTIDSMKQVPARTNQDQITPAVISGKQIWEDNNCMGCHTLFGEGAYYAPELTKVIERRGKPWLRIFLKDPEKMFPGQRKMVNYHFNEKQIEDVIAFLEWCGKVDLNGFPKTPPLQGLITPSGNGSGSSLNEPVMFATICKACHAIGGVGGVVGPALDDINTRKKRDELIDWISNPQKIKPGTAMPQIPLTDTQLNEIVDYLLNLSGGNSPTPQQPASTESFE